MGFRKLLIPIPIILCFSFLFPRSFDRMCKLRRHLYASMRIRLQGGESESYGHPFDPNQVTQILTHPRVYLYKNFLSDEECDHLIRLAEDKLERSLCYDSKTGLGKISSGRTSNVRFLNKAQDEVVAGIESRISAWTQVPVENGGTIKVLRYENGQKVVPHCDYFNDKTNPRTGRVLPLRMATVVMYLSDVKKGGETVFCHSEIKEFKPNADEDRSTCAKSGYAVKPKKGNAILFYNLHPDATKDPLSLHESRPVITGEKWCAIKLIHFKSFDDKGVGGSEIKNAGAKMSKA